MHHHVTPSMGNGTTPSLPTRGVSKSDYVIYLHSLSRRLRLSATVAALASCDQIDESPRPLFVLFVSCDKWMLSPDSLKHGACFGSRLEAGEASGVMPMRRMLT